MDNELQPRRRGWRSSWLAESVLGADEQAPYRPGRYLETPQRLGILPTWAFWNRTDVWKSARWLVAPVAGLSGFAVAMSGKFVTLPIWIVSLCGGLPVVVTMGLLERHIRKQLKR